MATCSTVSRVLRVRFSYEPQHGVFSLFGKVSDCESEEQGSIPEDTLNTPLHGGLSNCQCELNSRKEYTLTGKITIGGLPALDAGGCRFESYFSDKIWKYAEVRVSGLSVKQVSKC